jgi:hypothetical protein
MFEPLDEHRPGKLSRIVNLDRSDRRRLVDGDTAGEPGIVAVRCGSH